MTSYGTDKNAVSKIGNADIVDLLDSMPTIDAESTEGKVPQNVQGKIRFENIHFRYPTRPGVRVLRGLDLTVDMPVGFFAHSPLKSGVNRKFSRLSQRNTSLIFLLRKCFTAIQPYEFSVL